MLKLLQLYLIVSYKTQKKYRLRQINYAARVAMEIISKLVNTKKIVLMFTIKFWEMAQNLILIR